MLPSWQYPQPQEPSPARDIDPHGGGGGGKGFRPPNISTTHMILGFIGVFVLVGLVAVLVSTDSSEAQVAIISPKDGARVEAGKVPVRIRIEDGAVARWELSVTALDAATTRIPLARGGSGQNIGVYFVDLLQPGTYEVSLKVTDGEGNSSEVLSVFHVED